MTDYTEMIGLRLTSTQLKMLNEMACGVGITRSSLMRDLIISEYHALGEMD